MKSEEERDWWAKWWKQYYSATPSWRNLMVWILLLTVNLPILGLTPTRPGFPLPERPWVRRELCLN